MDIPGLDAWITGGRYDKREIVVTCPSCDKETEVLQETEYGASWWTPDECAHCGEEFPETAAVMDNEPDLPDRPEEA